MSPALAEPNDAVTATNGKPRTAREEASIANGRLSKGPVYAGWEGPQPHE